jgi:integrase
MSAIVCYHPHYEMGKIVGMKMARTLHRLTDIAAKSGKLTPGRHSDGGGLYLSISPTGGKSWLFMWSRDGKRREMGMGGYPAVSLAKARAKAKDCRETVAENRDPIAEKKREAEPTFAECVEKFLASMETGWRNEKHRAQWRMTLGESYCASLQKKRVSTIGTDNILSVLTPVWNAKPETASRLRGRIERVLEFAKAKGWRTGDNPALWRGHLRGVLPARKSETRGHHAAMDYRQVPAFLERVRGLEAMAARALEFLILTAARSGEVLGAQWAEIDFDAAVWTVPAIRMKAKKLHRVPLSKAALAMLKPLYEARVSDFIFPGQKSAKPLSNMAMEMLLRRMKIDGATVHGFRSSFRDWAGEETHFAREVAEAALAHEVGNAVEKAYRRGDALEKRRALMEAWATYLAADVSSNVVWLAR